MHPVLFRFPEALPLLGGKAIHVYGVMIALGFLIGLTYVRRESRRVGLDETKIADLFFWIMISGLVGARLFYIINSVDNFWSDPLVLFRIWEGGLVFQGGIIGALPVGFFFLRRHKLSFWKVADVFGPPLSLGHGLGRVGCFFAGCCYGKLCAITFPLRLIFPVNPDSVAPPGIPLYPTQPTEAIAEFAIFALLLYFRKRKPFDGAVFLLYIMIYSVLRAVVEIFRGDTIRGFVIEPYLSNGQLVSIVMIIMAGFGWVYLRNRSVAAHK